MNNTRVKILLNYIFGISSKEYQRRVWIKGEGPECDDFDETVNIFFEDVKIILPDYISYGLTENQYHMLKQFSKKFEAFVDSDETPYLPEDFIDTPEWTKITEMAKEVLKAFNWKMPASGHLF